MKSLFFLIFYLSIGSISSCNLDWNKEVHKAYKSEVFDSRVFKDLKVYDSIKNILVSNIDTIFYLINTKHQFNNLNQTSKERYLQQAQMSKNFIYEFDKRPSPDTISLRNMPNFIYQKLDSLLKIIDSDKILGFRIIQRTHPIFIINLEDTFDKETDVEIQHNLVWNWHSLKFTPKFQKDTILPGDWKYNISCFYKHQDNLK